MWSIRRAGNVNWGLTGLIVKTKVIGLSRTPSRRGEPWWPRRGGLKSIYMETYFPSLYFRGFLRRLLLRLRVRSQRTWRRRRNPEEGGEQARNLEECVEEIIELLQKLERDVGTCKEAHRRQSYVG